MPVQCAACSKVNPSEAVYCYYDGRALAQGSDAAPLRLGAMPFPMPFCFSDGESCPNFNQLALACDARWEEAKKLLTGSVWQTFFTAMGRLDLATAAQEAVRQPDLDVGLSQLLEKFPTDPDVLRPPQLSVSTTEQDLGTLAPGTDRTFPLQIANKGLLVLRGMVTSDCEWLSIGEPAGQPAMRMFQTRANHTLTVKVLGHKLRAGRKPLEGTLVVDTNGGNTTVMIRANVPVRPFPKGAGGNDVLAGATSPHELAVKAKAHPLEAAALFEQGAVRSWYASNGWTYPIQGTQSTGKGAVQQFFEALGLTKPPRLEISPQHISCKGKPGQRLSKHITISTQESRPVYASAWSDQAWVTPMDAKPQGNRITIPLQIDVPSSPGETLQASVIFQGNGNQQFIVPVSLRVVAARSQADEPEAAAPSRRGLVWALAAAPAMILLTAGIVGLILWNQKKEAGSPIPPIVDPGWRPAPPPPAAKNKELWWEKIPGAGLSTALAAVKELVPEQEKSLFDGIAAPSDVERYKTYESLEARLPELLRNLKIREPLGRVIAECCVFEPSELNISPLKRTLTSQIPPDRAEFRPEEQGDELKRGVWSLQVAFDALMNKAIRPERSRLLANQLGTVFGLSLDTNAAVPELKAQADRLFAMRCYRNVLPTAARSLDHALAMRETLLKQFPEQLPAAFRDKVDVDLVALGLSKNAQAFPKLEPILTSSLAGSDLTTAFKVAELFERADADLAPKFEAILATKWKAIANPKLNHAAKVAALRRALTGSVISPEQRQARLQQFATTALAAAKKPEKEHATLLQDTLRLAHASTMATALFNKDSQDRFDELALRTPEIEPPAEKKSAPEKPKEEPKSDLPRAPVTIGDQPKSYNGRLSQSSTRDQLGALCDIYPLSLQIGQIYTIEHVSKEFDASLRLENSFGQTIAEDANGGIGQSSRIVFQATMTGVHRLIASSLGGRGTGAYTLTIRRGLAAGGGFGFGLGRPVFLGGGPVFGRPLGGFPGFGLPGQGLPGKMPGDPEAKDKEKAGPQINQSDLANLESKQRGVRLGAVSNLASSFTAEVAPRHVRRLARYLLTIQDKAELDEVLGKLDSFARSRHLFVAVADQIGKDAVQKTAEAVVGGLIGQSLQFARDEDWRSACRRLLLQRALQNTGPAAAGGAAEQAADMLCALYREQSYIFGMDEKELEKLTRPAQALAALMKQVAPAAAQQELSPQDKEFVSQIGRYIRAAEFVADNELGQLVVLQRLWLRLLSLRLQADARARGAAMAALQQDLIQFDRRATSVLDQLRAGEESLLRAWALAHNLK